MMRMRFFVAAALLLSAGAAFAADQMSVTVQQTSVRDKPSFLGKILGTLKYADRVTVLDQPAGAPKSFLLILGPDGQLRGWVGATALQGKKIVLAAGSRERQPERLQRRGGPCRQGLQRSRGTGIQD